MNKKMLGILSLTTLVIGIPFFAISCSVYSGVNNSIDTNKNESGENLINDISFNEIQLMNVHQKLIKLFKRFSSLVQIQSSSIKKEINPILGYSVENVNVSISSIKYGVQKHKVEIILDKGFILEKNSSYFEVDKNKLISKYEYESNIYRANPNEGVLPLTKYEIYKIKETINYYMHYLTSIDNVGYVENKLNEHIRNINARLNAYLHNVLIYLPSLEQDRYAYRAKVNVVLVFNSDIRLENNSDKNVSIKDSTVLNIENVESHIYVPPKPLSYLGLEASEIRKLIDISEYWLFELSTSKNINYIKNMLNERFRNINGRINTYLESVELKELPLEFSNNSQTTYRYFDVIIKFNTQIKAKKWENDTIWSIDYDRLTLKNIKSNIEAHKQITIVPSTPSFSKEVMNKIKLLLNDMLSKYKTQNDINEQKIKSSIEDIIKSKDTIRQIIIDKNEDYTSSSPNETHMDITYLNVHIVLFKPIYVDDGDGYLYEPVTNILSFQRIESGIKTIYITESDKELLKNINLDLNNASNDVRKDTVAKGKISGILSYATYNDAVDKIKRFLLGESEFKIKFSDGFKKLVNDNNIEIKIKENQGVKYNTVWFVSVEIDFKENIKIIKNNELLNPLLNDEKYPVSLEVKNSKIMLLNVKTGIRTIINGKKLDLTNVANLNNNANLNIYRDIEATTLRWIASYKSKKENLNIMINDFMNRFVKLNIKEIPINVKVIITSDEKINIVFSFMRLVQEKNGDVLNPTYSGNTMTFNDVLNQIY